jgi:hypothetical protein
MTVKYVTHSLATGDITVLGHIADVVTVKGHTISRVGAIEGQEQQNPPAVHVNLEVAGGGEGSAEMLVLMLGLQDAVEMGLQLVAMGIEDNPTMSVEDVRDRLVRLVTELDQSLKVVP